MIMTTLARLAIALGHQPVDARCLVSLPAQDVREGGECT